MRVREHPYVRERARGVFGPCAHLLEGVVVPVGLDVGSGEPVVVTDTRGDLVV